MVPTQAAPATPQEALTLQALDVGVRAGAWEGTAGPPTAAPARYGGPGEALVNGTQTWRMFKAPPSRRQYIDCMYVCMYVCLFV